MKKIKTKQIQIEKIVAGILAMTLFLLVLIAPTYAYSVVDTTQAASLSLNYHYDSTPLTGVNVNIYKVADISKAARYKLSGDFKDYPVLIDGLEPDSEWTAAAETLYGYVSSDGITPTRSGRGDSSGQVTFNDLETGMYLVCTETGIQDGFVYTFSVFLISLPDLDTENDTWDYSVSAEPKCEREDDKSDNLSYSVVKKWDDAGNEDKRPASVKIKILKDGFEYKTVTLFDDNDWTFSWEAENDGSVWQVVETKVDQSYTVQVKKNDTEIVVTNTYKKTTGSSALPQTGQLWWPVPVMVIAGLVLFSLGWIMADDNKKKHE